MKIKLTIVLEGSSSREVQEAAWALGRAIDDQIVFQDILDDVLPGNSVAATWDDKTAEMIER